MERNKTSYSYQFTDPEVDILKQHVPVGSDPNSINWEGVAQLLPGKSAVQCREKCRILKLTNNPKRMRWTPEENQMLEEIIDKSRTGAGNISWESVYGAVEMNDQLSKFSHDSVRDHFKRVLSHSAPSWTQEEENRLMELAPSVYDEITGKHMWTDLLSQFPGKTSQDLKTQYTQINLRLGRYHRSYDEVNH